KHDLTIVLAEGSTNTVENTAGAAIVGDFGFDSGPSLIIEGSGTLEVSGSTSGIWVWQNVTIRDDAKVNVTGETKYGICNNISAGTITIQGNAQVTATGATYGIGYDYDDNRANIPVIQGGTVTITGGTAAVRVKNGSTESSPNLSGYTDGYKVTVGDAAPGTDWNNTTPLSDYKYLKIEPTDHVHDWSDTWSYDATYHWHECGNNDCFVTDNRYKDGFASHSGGTATCKDKAICTDCGQYYGSKDSNNHTGGTVTRDDATATETTPGYTGNTYCLGCNAQIGKGERIPATGNTNGSNQLESIAFGYAYNPQTGLAYSREVGNTMTLSNLDKPLLENGSPKEDYAGNWTLTKAGTYSYLKTYLEKNNKDMSNLESIVSTVVDQYGWSVEQKKKSVIYELKDGETHIAYGVILAYDTGRGRAVFVGDNMSGGAGYLLTKTELHVSTELGYLVTAVMNAGDFVFESEYHMLDGMNGKWTQGSNATLSFRADGDYSKFLGVMLDNSLLDTQKYTAASGSTIVTLKEDYLRTLAAGSHRLTVFYSDGECSTNFNIQASDDSDDESDDSPASDDSDDESDDSPVTAESSAAVVPAYVTHIVQKGDTLGAIARKYGCSVAEIMAENKNLIKNVNLIYPGWLLKIPQNSGNAANGSTQQTAVLPDAGKTRVYIVKRGDTLWAIARKYGCTSAEIIAWNNRLAANPNLIYAGWELVIPVK
ncbi:MAG: LysM peptidoglycan-binding domain-containing protein, partial [Acetatifactor sp.]